MAERLKYVCYAIKKTDENGGSGCGQRMSDNKNGGNSAVFSYFEFNLIRGNGRLYDF